MSKRKKNKEKTITFEESVEEESLFFEVEYALTVLNLKRFVEKA